MSCGEVAGVSSRLRHASPPALAIWQRRDSGSRSASSALMRRSACLILVMAAASLGGGASSNTTIPSGRRSCKTNRDVRASREMASGYLNGIPPSDQYEFTTPSVTSTDENSDVDQSLGHTAVFPVAATKLR